MIIIHAESNGYVKEALRIFYQNICATKCLNVRKRGGVELLFDNAQISPTLYRCLYYRLAAVKCRAI